MATPLLYRVNPDAAGVPQVLTVTGRDAASDCCCGAEAATCHWYTEWTWFCAMSCDPSPLANLDAPAVIEGSVYATGQWNNMDENSTQKAISGSLPDSLGYSQASAVARLLDGTVGTYKRELPPWVEGGPYEQCDVVQHEGYGYRCVRANRQTEFEPTVNGVVYWTSENTWVNTGEGTVCVEEGDVPLYAGYYYLHSCAAPAVLTPRPQGPCGYVYRMYGPPHEGTCSSCPAESDASTVKPSFDIECPAFTCCVRPRFSLPPQEELRQPCKIVLSVDDGDAPSGVTDIVLSLQSVEDLRTFNPARGSGLVYAHIPPEGSFIEVAGTEYVSASLNWSYPGGLNSTWAAVEFVQKGANYFDPSKTAWAVKRTIIGDIPSPRGCTGFAAIRGTYFSPVGGFGDRMRIWFDDPEV